MDSTTSQPPRRWFRFGLRTMFVVVTVFSLWLGWQAKIVRDRKDAIQRLEAAKGFVFRPGDRILLFYNRWKPRIPFLRHWMGDQPVSGFALPKDYPRDRIDKLRTLFPEATAGGSEVMLRNLDEMIQLQ